MSCPYHRGMNRNRSDCGFCISARQQAEAAKRQQRNHDELMGALSEQTGAIRETTGEVHAFRVESAQAAARQEALLAEANMYASITAQATETIAAITAEEADRTQRFHFSQYIQTPHGQAYLDWQKRASALADRIGSMTVDWTNAWIGRAQTAAGPLDPYLAEPVQPDVPVKVDAPRQRSRPWGLYLLLGGIAGFPLGIATVVLVPNGPSFGARGVVNSLILEPLNALGWAAALLGLPIALLGLIVMLSQAGTKGAKTAYGKAQTLDVERATGAMRTMNLMGAGRAYTKQAPMIEAYNLVLADRLGPGLVHVAPTTVVEGAGVNAWLPGALGMAQEWTAGTRPITSGAIEAVSEHLAERRAAAAQAALPKAAAGMLRVWDRPRYEMVVARSWSSWNLSEYLFSLASFAEQARTHYPSPDQLPELRYPPAVELASLGANTEWLPEECRQILADAAELYEMGPLNAPAD